MMMMIVMMMMEIGLLQSGGWRRRRRRPIRDYSSGRAVVLTPTPGHGSEGGER
ncbi:hypothetical protein RHMOL_Rhmol03G0261700 [Rhododendron molle]|uniref:Uncharacterized protein n=1 Tax=Rhododendron molle TaxID=49168 RepID=A0ACC0PL66_RHOML|nr:hypothetical protein RHMOL_Rhmol03G0261700 [Rhododendron molle]